MKLFSFFLPQFHQIPENDEWWGEGFTEWVNVKNAKPLFNGHKQPLAPLNGNYYNLLNKETVQWQTDLMHQYGLYGMVYYHYYFQGKLLLEKPAENLLKWKDIHQPFFFCWANHTWRRTWEGTQTILLEQTYGDIDAWEEHFQYLVPFFQDSRYEKKDNCPLFMIFNTQFSEKNKMLQYFDKRCRDYGFNGLWLIDCSHGKDADIENLRNDKPTEKYSILLREPEYSKIKHYESAEASKWSLYKHAIDKRLESAIKKEKSRVTRFSNNALFAEKIKHYCPSKDLLQCLCFSWDNTPRHGRRGYIIDSVDKRHFMKYMNTIKEEEYCFINAWNEWAEGMILEPTEQNGYRYLEWIKEWIDHNG